ncbi:MAG: type II secretion system protein GspK [Phycisphaerales bacterium]
MSTSRRLAFGHPKPLPGGGALKRRGFATLFVFLVIVFGAIIVSMVQTASYAQAAAGRESLARVRAHWAARGGLEMALSRLEKIRDESDNPAAYDMLDSMAQVADGELDGATWRVRSLQGGKEVSGPADCAARINLGRVNSDILLSIEPFMSEDTVDAILDWMDEDDDTREMGAELGYYRGLRYPFEPRNGMPRSIAEMELMAGVDPESVRGEDWNLNGLLDPNEDDGDASWPPDNADGILDRGWSGLLTVYSVEQNRGPSGEPKLELPAAKENDLVTRLGISNDQAKAIVDYMDTVQGATLTEFVRQTLPRLAQQAARSRGATRQEIQQAGRVRDLSTEQLGKLLDETSMFPPEILSYVPGRININTCDATTLDYLPMIEPELADSIIAERSSKTNGFENLAELLEVDGMSRQTLATIVELLCVRSNVYELTSKGVDEKTGLEVEIVAVMDASTLPAALREVRVR